MKTDDLVAALSAHIEPVNRRLLSRTVYIALAAGTVVAFGLMLVGLGVRADLMTDHALMFLLLKLAFTVGVVGVASVYLMRLARPGGERRTSSILAMMPFAAIVLLAAISLGLAPSSHWDEMVMGDEWFECLLSIPIIAIVPFAVIIAAVRRAAPTNLARTGAVAGLVACRRRERDGLCASLHGRFIAICGGLVRRHDCAVHVSRRSIGTAIAAVVMGLIAAFTSA